MSIVLKVVDPGEVEEDGLAFVGRGTSGIGHADARQDNQHVPISDLVSVSQNRAEEWVQEENDRRYDAASRNRPFYYDDHGSWLIANTDKGAFVAHLVYAGGGGLASYPLDEKDYCNLRLEYELHARVTASDGDKKGHQRAIGQR